MVELVPIPSPGETLFFGDAGDPLVVIVHDYYGRLPWLDPYATALARVGFRVAVPDLYDGYCTTDEPTATGLLDQLDLGASLALLDDLLEQGRRLGSTRFATVGFSMGGWLALLHAQAGGVDAVVAYYATLQPAQHGVIPCPVMLHFAEADDWAAGGEPEEFIDRLKEHGTPVTPYDYLGTEHSFANASLPAKANPDAAALAFARTARFLEDLLLD